ncbi:hypothetical protein PoB_002837700 [Plakobranchus ocellatus]|uniref:Uncharacterized protein n=1 Tax=Plakobranchus ocellatus TaxID=259542 RepID=A0AAV4A4U6_9GAST|nr:hypothetical protein PoB_002837700 [Plakobranchus ocellatus]
MDEKHDAAVRIDVRRFKPHSARSATSSAAERRNVPLSTILDATSGDKSLPSGDIKTNQWLRKLGSYEKPWRQDIKVIRNLW